MQGTQEWKESEEEERLVSKDIVKNIVTNFQEAPKYLKDARDTGVEGKRGRGKTRIERYSETIVTKFQEAHWREKLVDIV